MHEMGIANSILEAVQKELHSYPGLRAAKVGVRIGEYAGVNAESLRFCFEVLTKSSELQVPELEISECAGEALDLIYIELADIELPEIELAEVANGTENHRDENPERKRSYCGAVA